MDSYGITGDFFTENHLLSIVQNSFFWKVYIMTDCSLTFALAIKSIFCFLQYCILCIANFLQNSWPSDISFLWHQKLVRTHLCQSEICQILGPSQRKVFYYCKKNWIFNVISQFLQNCYLIVDTSNRIPDQLYFVMFFSQTTIYTKK